MINNLNMMNKIHQSVGVKQADINESAPVQERSSSAKHVSVPQFGGFSHVSFGNVQNINLNTTLRTPDEQKKFAEISNALEPKTRAKLNVLLKNGRLLSTDSNDKSTTLDNLYNIIKNKRMQGLDEKTLLKDVITAIENPFTITQKFGDIPAPVEKELLDNSAAYGLSGGTNYLDLHKQGAKEPASRADMKSLLDVVSSSCVAASIQFNLAHKNPAEYARIAEGLSSEKMSVEKKIKVSDVAPSAVDAMWLLDAFHVPRKQLDWDNVIVDMAPDRNAIIRARIQSSYRDKGERSPMDVLMQSTFMNIGSQQTYNTITDIRTGAFNADNRGLTDIEKNLAEVIAEGRNKISVTYQVLDEEGRLVGYECPQENTLKHISDALKIGENVVVGYTHTDSTNKVVNGHEITIIGLETGKNGKQVFVCNDTDDMKDEPVRYDVDYLLPKIHHAGLPREVLKDDVEIVEGWVDVLNQYKNSMSQPKQVPQPKQAA